MFDVRQLQDLIENGGTVLDQDGNKIGKLSQLYLDDQTGTPEWVTVSSGLLGGSESFVPLQGAVVTDRQVKVPYTKATVKDAPQEKADSHLSWQDEDELYRYYGLEYAEPGPAVASTDEAMTRSEEQVRVGTERQETGKARLRKYVVTEEVQTTVPVRHEEVRVEREPITEQNRGEAMSGPAFTEQEHEVTLHAEEPVVEKEEKPVERVRLETEEVRDEAEINEEVRKEQISAEGNAGERR